jgi:antitoxin VapB
MKTAKVFTQGNSQAVRLPKEFRVDDDELFIKKSGDGIVLAPKGKARWKNLKAAMSMFRGGLERRQPKDFDKRNMTCMRFMFDTDTCISLLDNREPEKQRLIFPTATPPSVVGH